PVMAPAPAPVAIAAQPPPVAPVMAPRPVAPGDDPQVPSHAEGMKAPRFIDMPDRTDLKALPPAPLPNLVRHTAKGDLPVMSADGLQSWIIYGRPATIDPQAKKLAVVISGLGLNREATNAAINKLPPEVSLSFSPYAKNLDDWVKRARAAGHEVLLDVPMEPVGFPYRDSGPLALARGMAPSDIIDRLERILGKASGYVGVVGQSGSPLAQGDGLMPLWTALRERGLMYVGEMTRPPPERAAAAAVTMSLDDKPFRAAIDARLTRAVSAARADGAAVVVAQGLPVTFERLLSLASNPRGITLVPVSIIPRSGRPS
ncbi:MAG: divergent polysaccharide deacetylase family protein, partial [Rhodospirillales bacterium]|nr:divergent polysaccharide deacetylase family protein [Rhodospirillales bacterium]